MKTIYLSLTATLLLLTPSCSSDDNITIVEETKEPTKVTLPLSGKYQWGFEIPGMGEQVSIHDFKDGKIEYIMSGSAYSNSYDMIPESYNATEKRIVAVGKGGEGTYNKDGVYFVMFFKDLTDNTVSLYKKECTSKEEAYSFAVPADNNTENHGWNIYKKE